MSLTDGIIGCWSPSIRGSGYLLPDLSGRGNHGVLTNMDAGTDWPGATVRGVSGRVLDFDGTDDQIKVPSSYLQFTGPQFVGMWVLWRTITIANRPQLWTMGDLSGNFATQMACGINNIGSGTSEGTSRLTLNAYTGALGTWGRAYTNTTFGTRLNEWIHLLFGHDGTTWKIYVNGVSDAVVDQTTGPQAMTSAASLYIGSSATARYTDGQIGETVFWRRTVTNAEAVELFRQGNGAIGRQLTGQTRRRVYGFAPATGARRRRILTGMV